MSPKASETVTIRMPAKLKFHLQARAKTNNESLNQTIVKIITQALKTEATEHEASVVGPALREVINNEFKKLSYASSRSAIESLVASQMMEFMIVNAKLLAQEDATRLRQDLLARATKIIRTPLRSLEEPTKGSSNHT